MRKEAYAVILAGGRGERFWPRSRAARPKQLLPLLGRLTLIEQTFSRLTPLFPPENILVLTNADYERPIRTLLSAIPPENILGEPLSKNTAPCVAMAAAFIRNLSKTPDPVIAFFPSDHAIRDADSFRAVIRDCLDVAQNGGGIITIGIRPTFAGTGYGYIKIGKKAKTDTPTVFRSALGFREKPSAKTAEKYLKSGDYRWNSGIFVMTYDTLSSEMKAHAPFLKTFHDALLKVFRSGDKEGVLPLYESVRKISIDCALMEKAGKISVANADFDWDDVGTWTSMKNQLSPDENGNAVFGLHTGLGTKNCVLIGSDSHLLATLDLEDVIVVHTPDATLVCRGKSAQHVGELVNLIRSNPELASFL